MQGLGFSRPRPPVAVSAASVIGVARRPLPLRVKVEIPWHAKIPGLRLNVIHERSVDFGDPLVLHYWQGRFKRSEAQILPFGVTPGDRVVLYLEALGGPLLGFKSQHAVVPTLSGYIEVIFRPRPTLFGIYYRRPGRLEFRTVTP